MEFIQYEKCSTCQKAKKFLESNKVSFKNRSIIEETPTKEELTKWIKDYNIDIKKLFNTSGLVYKEMKLKEKLDYLTMDEKIALLASNGKLIKRPLLVKEDGILIGFKEKEYQELIRG